MINYNFKNDIKTIRLCFELSQEEFSSKVNLSRSNIARYESGTIIPRYDALERIYNYSFENEFDINKAKTMIYDDRKGDYLILFHGAKGEIIGEVDAKHSRGPNDFGSGFYLGQTLQQANMWVAPFTRSSTYCFYFKNHKSFKTLHFDVNYEWMMTILYYRGELEGFEIPDDIKSLIEKVEKADYIVAPIADNQMYDTIEMFRNNIISDVACLHALSANNLGYQYVIKSEQACKNLIPVDRLYLCQKEKDYYLNLKAKSSSEGKSKTTLAITKYRKEGKLFNEIFKKQG